MSKPSQPGDSRLLLLAPEDNVVVARVDINPGECVTIDGNEVVIKSLAPVGFKIARQSIRRGQQIVKYGAPIGSATASIAAGDVVHLDNMKSDYLPTYTLDGPEQYTKEVKQ